MNNRSQRGLNFSVSGQGKPLVLLHGFLESVNMWDGLNFGENVKLIKIDLPGHGRSSFNPEKDLTIHGMALRVLEVLNSCIEQEYDVIGHSMGGYIALELKNLDTNCDKVILLNSNFWKDSEKKKSERKRVAAVVKSNKNLFICEAIPNLYLDAKKSQDHIAQLIEEAKQIDAESISMTSIAMSSRSDHSVLVMGNPDKYLILQGKFDRVVSVDKMKKKIGEIKINYNELNGGHMAHVECKTEVENCVMNFLQENKKTETT